MGKARVFNWPAIDVAAICALQSTSGAGYLLLNGTLASPAFNNGLSVPLVNIQRTITIKSSNDLSAVTFVITGTLQGAIVSVSHAGPDATTYTTTQLFDSITSVHVSAAVTAVEIGSGDTGQSSWWTYDKFSAYGAATVACIATATINYSLQVTLDNVLTAASPNVFTPVSTLTSATGSILAAITPLPIEYANIIINSSSGSGALVATFLQEGLTS